MAFTGDLEQLHIVDIIQLINTARKSGTFTVKGSRGESRLIFSNGYIVGASHLNNLIRIGTVLVKMNAITNKDLAEALDIQKKAGKNRKPLISTLLELGKLGREDASRGLRKLIEMALVELIGLSKGTFTLDTDVIAVSPECSYPLSKMEQEISIDAQMILMDALRIFDERERDRSSGKIVPSDEELYAEEISAEEAETKQKKSFSLTADDLGLGDLDQLERKIPQFVPADEIFDPLEIHRQKIKEILGDYSAEEQEIFVSFLEKSAKTRSGYDSSQRQEGPPKGLILFSEDELFKHSIMTICKDEGVLVFAAEGEKELLGIIDQCLAVKVLPALVFDYPWTPEGLITLEKIVDLRLHARNSHPQVPIIQLASIPDYDFTLRAFHDGIRAVFPKPSREARKATFIEDTILFLKTFQSYIKDLFQQQGEYSAEVERMIRLRDCIIGLRDLEELSPISVALLQYVSRHCERAITFIVHQADLAGEKAIGVYDEKNAGPTAVTRLKVPLSRPSVFLDLIEKGELFYGEINDDILNNHLFEAIGAPLSPVIMLLPIKTRGKTSVLIYGDFGGKEPATLKTSELEILASSAGLVLENSLCRLQIRKAAQQKIQQRK